jgi:hypothetical protein
MTLADRILELVTIHQHVSVCRDPWDLWKARVVTVSSHLTMSTCGHPAPQDQAPMACL